MAGTAKNLESGGIYINKWLSGLYDQRSPLYMPLSAMGVQLINRLDTLLDGENTDISRSMTLIRRPGFARYCSAPTGIYEAAPLGFFSFKNTAGTVRAMVDTPDRVAVFSTTAITTVFDKTSTAQISFNKVGDYLYMANGNDADMLKWGGNQNMLQQSEQFDSWEKAGTGSAAPTVTPNTTSDPNGDLTADTLNYATNTTGHYGEVSQRVTPIAVKNRTFMFSLWMKVASGTQSVHVIIADEPFTQSAVDSPFTVTTTWQRFTTYGTFTGTANNAVRVYIRSQSLATTPAIIAWGAQLEYGTVASTYAPVTQSGLGLSKWGIAAPVTAPTLTFSAGTLNPLKGYSYVYVYQNSSTGHISSASPLSANTSALVNQNITLHGTQSLDPQVDKVQIFRTLDGGGDYYLVTTINNTASWTYTDSTQDAALNTFIQPALAHENDPPPSGLSLTCFYLGRMWGAVDNYLYAGGGPDIVNGNPEECWPPANVWTLPGKITAMCATSQGLLVWTSNDMFCVLGTTLTSFVPKLIQANFGVMSQNSIASDGDTFFIFSSQRQLFEFSSSMTEIGFPIQSRLGAFDAANVHLALHRYSADEGLFISDGAGKIYRYSVSMQAWSTLYLPTGGSKCIRSMEVSAGKYALMLGRASAGGYILARDPTVFADDSVAYTAYATIGSLVLAPPGQTSMVNSVLVEALPIGTYPTISVLLNEISGNFVPLPQPVPDPPALPASTTVLAKRHYLKAAQTPLPQHVRHMLVKVSYAAEAAGNTFLGLAIG